MSLLHAHPLVQVPVTGIHQRDAHLHRAIIRTAHTKLDTHLVEFNGPDDRVHLLIASTPTPRSPVWCRGSTAAPGTRCGATTPVSVSAPACAHTFARRPTSPSLQRRTTVNHQAIHPRTSPTTINAGLRPRRTGWAKPGLTSEACAQEFRSWFIYAARRPGCPYRFRQPASWNAIAVVKGSSSCRSSIRCRAC
jgi:hypothetical protein